jgi:pyocin large subunit-like protein
VGKRKKFNRIPKTEDLIPQLREAGLGLHVLPTYICLLDHADSRGRCWPSINRMARILGLCRRTVERHMKQLCEAGLVLRNHQQRARRGRFSTRRYVVVAILFLRRATVRHQGRTRSRSLYRERTKDSLNSEKSQESREEKRQREARRRREGYEWLFEYERERQ